MCALATSRTSATWRPLSLKVPILNNSRAKPIDSPSSLFVLGGPSTSDGHIVHSLNFSRSAISHAAFSAKTLDNMYAPFSRVLDSFQSFSQYKQPGSSLPPSGLTAAIELVKATHSTVSLLFATDSKTVVVPSTAGFISFSSTASTP